MKTNYEELLENKMLDPEFRVQFLLAKEKFDLELMIDSINKTNGFNIKEFNTAANTIKNNLNNILNFFINRHTNANAESFNSKIKLFRANLRGVVDTKFFLFRLEKLFA